MSRKVPIGEFSVSHDCGFTTTATTQGRANRSLARHSCDRTRMLAARAERVKARVEADGPKRDCECKYASHEHGTTQAYKIDGCRCRPCREASTITARDRTKAQTFGRYDSGRVEAGPVREHVQYLLDSGIGTRRLAELAKVSRSSIQALMYGRPERGHGPYNRVSKTSAAKILAVQPSSETLAAQSQVNPAGTVRRLQALVAIGWPQAQLSTEIGINRSNIGPVILGQRNVTARTALAVRDLYERLWDKPPSGEEWQVKRSASRARKYAAERGWAPPMAWDDDQIDNPVAEPTGFDRGSDYGKRVDNRTEDVEFLLDSGAGLYEIQTRCGISVDSLIETLARRANRPDLAERISAMHSGREYGKTA